MSLRSDFSIAAVFVSALMTAACGTRVDRECRADPAALKQARDFLSSPKVGVEVIEYMHYGAHYTGHKFLKAVPVYDAAGKHADGSFGLVFRFRWSVAGVSDTMFLCDETGRIYDIQILKSNARSNAPFELANEVIQILGNELLGSYPGLTDAVHQTRIQELEAADDAQGMLIWHLGMEQCSLPKVTSKI